MEFFDKLTKKATETYKGAAEKTSKLAKETKLKMKISDNKSKIDDLYKEIGKKVYQKHKTKDDNCVKNQIEEELAQIDSLSQEIDSLHDQILELSNEKVCIKCKETMDINSKFCPKCGTEQPIPQEPEAMEVEVLDVDNKEEKENSENTQEEEHKEQSQEQVETENKD